MLIPLLILPLVGLFLINISRNPWKMSLIISILQIIHTTFILIIFDSNQSEFQFQEIIKDITIGIDGISIWLIWLINLLTPILILSSYKSIKSNEKVFISLIILINF